MCLSFAAHRLCTHSIFVFGVQVVNTRKIRNWNGLFWYGKLFTEIYRTTQLCVLLLIQNMQRIG